VGWGRGGVAGPAGPARGPTRSAATARGSPAEQLLPASCRRVPPPACSPACWAARCPVTAAAQRGGRAWGQGVGVACGIDGAQRLARLGRCTRRRAGRLCWQATSPSPHRGGHAAGQQDGRCGDALCMARVWLEPASQVQRVAAAPRRGGGGGGGPRRRAGGRGARPPPPPAPPPPPPCSPPRVAPTCPPLRCKRPPAGSRSATSGPARPDRPATAGARGLAEAGPWAVPWPAPDLNGGGRGTMQPCHRIASPAPCHAHPQACMLHAFHPWPAGSRGGSRRMPTWVSGRAHMSSAGATRGWVSAACSPAPPPGAATSSRRVPRARATSSTPARLKRPAAMQSTALLSSRGSHIMQGASGPPACAARRVPSSRCRPASSAGRVVATAMVAAPQPRQALLDLRPVLGRCHARSDGMSACAKSLGHHVSSDGPAAGVRCSAA